MKLKTLFLTWLTALALYTAKGQEITDTAALETIKNFDIELAEGTNQEAKKDTAKITNPFKITSGYAGQLTWVTYNKDNLDDGKMDVSSNTRVWGWLKYTILNKRKLAQELSLNTWGVAQYDPDKKWLSFRTWQAFLKWIPVENLAVLLWNPGTPETLNRPFPPSWGSHFETWTQALMKWGTLWGRVDWILPISARQWKANVNGSLWIARRWGEMEYGANIGYKNKVSKDETNKINIAWHYSNKDVWGWLVSWNYRSLSWAFVYKEEWGKLWSSVWHQVMKSFDLPWKSGILLAYFVQNWNKNPETAGNYIPTQSELWLLWIWEVEVWGKTIDVTTGPWYDFLKNNLNFYVQISIDVNHQK